MILKGYVEKGETLYDAIERVAVLAGQNGCSGYQIHCSKCDEIIGPEPPCYCMSMKIDNRLEDLSNKVRRGVPIDVSEALEVIEYQSQPKSLFDKIREWFLNN